MLITPGCRHQARRSRWPRGGGIEVGLVLDGVDGGVDDLALHRLASGVEGVELGSEIDRLGRIVGEVSRRVFQVRAAVIIRPPALIRGPSTKPA